MLGVVRACIAVTAMAGEVTMHNRRAKALSNKRKSKAISIDKEKGNG